METTWKLTDGSLFQYGRKIGDGVYQFKEFDRSEYKINPKEGESDDEFIDVIFDDPEFWIELTITLSEYTPEQIDNYISGYYDGVEEVKVLYNDDWEWIVAECIFEQISDLY